MFAGDGSRASGFCVLERQKKNERKRRDREIERQRDREKSDLRLIVNNCS